MEGSIFNFALLAAVGHKFATAEVFKLLDRFAIRAGWLKNILLVEEAPISFDLFDLKNEQGVVEYIVVAYPLGLI